MLYGVFQVGDEVVIDIPQENRDWGYNPRSNGSHAVIAKFGEIDYGRIGNFGHKPGFYVNKAWATILDGMGELHISTLHLKLADQAEYERRVAEWREQNKGSLLGEKEFLRDLPDTPFWEGDKVRVHRDHVGVMSIYGPDIPDDQEPEQYVVVRIDYRKLGDRRLDGSQYPAYDISDKLGAGWNTAASEEEMELVERGNVWKHFHDEPLRFADLTEEATFYRMLGEIDEVRNPANGLFSWTKDEALEAVKDGIGDAIMMGGIRFSLDEPPNISVTKFRNEELGCRVAAMTLAGFGVKA